LTSLALRLSCDDSYLPAFVSGAVRKKPIVVALCAGGADGDLLHSGLSGVLGDERSEVDVTRPSHRLSSELLAYVRGHLVAASAD
jgi:hypothetical protein